MKKKTKANPRIEITCVGAGALPWKELTSFQGELKDLSEDSYNRLKNEILETGFSEPVSVWKSPDKKVYILNGHQRVRAVGAMEEEGYEIPPLPVSFIQAKDKRQAKRKVLALTSQYGEMTKQGLYEFMNEAGLQIGEVESWFRFPEINLEEFKAEFFEDKEYDKDGSQEVDDLGEFDVQCPRCGFQWQTKKTASEKQD